MFGSIREDIKYQWNKPNSGIQQLIIINVIVFAFVNVVRLFVNPGTYDYFIEFVAMPVDLDLLLTRPWTIVTSFFTHQGIMHILFNMLYLYWFGMVLREFLGSDRLIALFVLGGLMGSLAIIVLFNFIPAFYETSGGIALGASAGVYAVTIGAATLAPNYSFNLLFFGPVKIKYIAGFLVVLSFFGLKGYNFGGEVAHLSGALIGYFYVKSLQSGTDLGNWITRFLLYIKSFFVRQSKMKVNYSRPSKSSTRTKTKSAPVKGSKNPSQDEIDAILDKISQNGYESLSKDEKEKLFNASKK